MKKPIIFLLCVLLVCTIVSCTSIAPLTATSNEIGRKVGESTSSYLFGIFPMGDSDSGIYAAARNGGISKISTVDVKTYMGIFVSRVTTVVTGE